MHMTERFDELGYVLPAETPEQYAQQASTILEDLIDSDPGTAIYLMEPSAVLALAGLRAQSPYHRFGTEVTADQKQTFDSILHKHDIHRMGDDSDTSFFLLNSRGVDDIKNRYTFFADKWVSPTTYDSDAELHAWDNKIRNVLDNAMLDNELPNEWLQAKEWAVNDLRFGTMLGYPGKAISSALWASSKGDVSGSETLSDIIIADGKPYYGTHVSFNVHPSVLESDEIVHLRKLWSKTIEIVYETLPFDELMKNEQFAEAHKHLVQSQED